MLPRMEALEAGNAGIAAAEAVYAHCRGEIDMLRRQSKSYGYTCFVLQRT